jgi:hypothetical protein
VFRQGVTDEKMLEKLATHYVQDISKLFHIADKCARATEGRAWHSQPSLEAGKASKPNTDAATQGSSKKKNKKKAGSKDKLLVGAPTVVAAAAHGGHGPYGDKRPRQTSASDEGSQRCPIHNSKCHSAEESWEIKKLAEQFHEQQNLQPRHDGTPPRQWEGQAEGHPGGRQR